MSSLDCFCRSSPVCRAESRLCMCECGHRMGAHLNDHRTVSPCLVGPDPVDESYCRCPWFRPRGTQTLDPPDFWSSLTDEQRLSFLEAHPCCRSCGSLDTGCHCNNDE